MTLASAQIFHAFPLTAAELAVVGACSLAPVAGVEIVKLLRLR